MEQEVTGSCYFSWNLHCFKHSSQRFRCARVRKKMHEDKKQKETDSYSM